MDERKVLKKVSDLGACAYLLMHGFKVKKHINKVFLFDVSENDVSDFEEKQTDYLQSEFHRFDACLMSLKKWRSNED